MGPEAPPRQQKYLGGKGPPPREVSASMALGLAAARAALRASGGPPAWLRAGAPRALNVHEFQVRPPPNPSRCIFAPGARGLPQPPLAPLRLCRLRGRGGDGEGGLRGGGDASSKGSPPPPPFPPTCRRNTGADSARAPQPSGRSIAFFWGYREPS